VSVEWEPLYNLYCVGADVKPCSINHIKVTSTVALHLTLNILETVRDRGLVPMDYQQEMAYGLSNGHVTDDVT